MSLSPEIRKLLQQTLKIRNSQVPLHRVIDILATPNGDISEVVNRFQDVKDEDLRRALHFCAVLLRELEGEAGLRPAWETAPAPEKSASAPAQPQSEKPAKAESKTTKSTRFRPEDLESFESEELRGKVPVAKVYVDGASKGNPGEAGIGVALQTMDGKKVAQVSRAIGTATNNIAEYSALIEALHLAQRMGVKSLCVLSDSQLMVNQMNGLYKIKNPDILKKVQEAKRLTREFGRFTISFIEREYNTLADALSTAKLKKKGAPPTEASTDLLPPLSDSMDEGQTE